MAEPPLRSRDRVASAIEDDRDELRDVYVFRGGNSGWIVTTDGNVRARCRGRVEAQRALRGVILWSVMQGLPGSFLVQGSYDPIERRLRLRELTGVSASSSLLILVGDGAPESEWLDSPREFAGFQVLRTSSCQPRQVVLDEGEAAPGRNRSVISGEEALLHATCAVRDFGSTPDRALEAIEGILGAGGCEVWLHGESHLGGAPAQPPEPALPSRVLGPSAGRVVRSIGEGKWLAVHPVTRRPLLLNEHSMAILDLLDGERTHSDLVATVSSAFDAEAGTIDATLTSLIAAFAQSGLVNPVAQGHLVGEP